MNAPQPFRAGVVAVIGRPNVGKSSLVNALIGYKVSIVAHKAQTTRHRILGVVTDERGQIVFADTPGLHAGGGRAINRYLNRAARGSLVEADVVALVVEAQRWDDEDELALAAAREAKLPIVLVINKIDKLRQQRTDLLPLLARLGAKHDFAALVPVSALKQQGLDDLRRTLLGLLPEGEAMFEPDAITDRSQRFLAAETIREQVVRQLHEELPYASTVEIDEYTVEPGLTRISATLWVEREGQKAIAIGKKGEQIKMIGTAARQALEKQLDGKVFLELQVRVRDRWCDDEAALGKFGYVD